MLKNWGLQEAKEHRQASPTTIMGVINMLKENLDEDDRRPRIHLGIGDPSSFPCFRTATVAEDAIVDAAKSGNFNSYPPEVGILPARRAIAEYLSRDLPCRLSPDDVYLTLGCKQAIEIMLAVLAKPNANILLPKPGFPRYEAYAAISHVEVRHFNLIPEKGWEVDLDAVEALADENTVAMVIINPGNPCGNVYTQQHLQKIAETARNLGILVIADEVYGHFAFGKASFVPMGVFGSTVPVVTLGSLSKRWMVPGWRLGWLVTTDPSGSLKKYGIIQSIKSFLSISVGPPIFIQGAVPQILERTTKNFFSKSINILSEASEIFYNRTKEIPCITCPNKPQGSIFAMVMLDMSQIEGINDDMEFSLKLAKEESLIVLPGVTVGLKNWLRITLAVEISSLEDGIQRLKAFCQRYSRTG